MAWTIGWGVAMTLGAGDGIACCIVIGCWAWGLNCSIVVDVVNGVASRVCWNWAISNWGFGGFLLVGAVVAGYAS